MRSIYLEGMLGLGDNIHQRAIIKYYLKGGYDITLSTPWPQIYHDFLIKLVKPKTELKAQKKNMLGKEKLYLPGPIDMRGFSKVKKIWYTSSEVRRTGSILGAMLANSGISETEFDFSFSPSGRGLLGGKKFSTLFKTSKPVLFYRPLVERTEWVGCANRNPDKNHYLELINYIKDKFFVVSVADTDGKTEWVSGGEIAADLTFHRGELDFNEMADLMYFSDLAFCSPGFALVLAQSTHTPNICVYGGRENSGAYKLGNHIAPSLGIDTIKPCLCFDHTHNCVKTIDVYKAKKKIDYFLNDPFDFALEGWSN